MNRRVIAALATVVLAIVAIFMLISYANNADERAVSGAKLTDVLRVKTAIAAQTPAADLGGSVELVKIPANAIAEGAISDLSEVAGLLTSIDLQPGEQLLKARFVKKGATAKTGNIPTGMQEVTISLAKTRLVGGRLAVGDKVGVLASYPSGSAGLTAFAIKSALITKFDAAVLSASGGGESVVDITFALDTLDAERIVHAAEFGKIWLTKLNDQSDLSGGKLVDQGDVAR